MLSLFVIDKVENDVGEPRIQFRICGRKAVWAQHIQMTD